MRVLQVTPGIARRYGGPAVAVAESSRALNALGIETTIVAPDMAEVVTAKDRRPIGPGDLPAGAEELDIRLFPVRWPQRLVFSPEMYRELGRQAREHDVVHIHSLFLFPHFAAYRHASRNRTPYIVSPCGALDPYLRHRSRRAKAVTDRLWQRAMLDRAAALHYKTEEEARLVEDLGLAPRPVVVPNGIRWDAFQDLPPRAELRDAELGGFDGPLVLYMGRVSHKKGIDVLIRSLALLEGEHAEARLLVCGPDDEGLTPELRALAERLGVADRVVFAGMVSGRRKLAALAAADVWALASHTENFGQAVIEALAAGLPTVVSPGVNIADAMADAGAGVVAELDPRAFADALAALLADDARRAALGEAARAFARRYDWHGVAPRLAEMYAQVANGNGNGNKNGNGHG